MADHEMVPSEVEGFHMQCKHCKALDTEIRFALGNECPKAPANDAKPGIVQIIPQTQPLEPTWEQKVIMLQSNWMAGYFNRQFMKTLKR